MKKFPDYNYLKIQASTFFFKVDFSYWVQRGNITQEEFNELTAINDKHLAENNFPVFKG